MAAAGHEGRPVWDGDELDGWYEEEEIEVPPLNLPWPTPEPSDLDCWQRLAGAPVLANSDGEVYKIDGRLMDGAAVLRGEHSRCYDRFWRENGVWYWGFGDRTQEFVKWSKIAHVADGDPRLPPTGYGWSMVNPSPDTDCDDQAYYPQDAFPSWLYKATRWAVTHHRRYPMEIQGWVVHLFLCAQRLQSTDDVLVPRLPPELWFMVLRQMYLCEMLPADVSIEGFNHWTAFPPSFINDGYM